MAPLELRGKREEAPIPTIDFQILRNVCFREVDNCLITCVCESMFRFSDSFQTQEIAIVRKEKLMLNHSCILMSFRQMDFMIKIRKYEFNH